jgi:L-lactate dehydrogenase complex protein LldE
VKRVSVHIPCLVDTLMPETGKSVIRLLERLDIPYVYHTNQTCCGQPSYNEGFVPETKKIAKHFIDVFGEDEVVVSISGSCVTMVRSHYPMILAEESDWRKRAEDLSGRVYELTQYLVDVLGIEDVGGRFDGRVAYHESCSLLRGLGVSEQPKKLIRSLVGTELVEMQRADVCCGFGGEFSRSYHEISEHMVADKVKNFLQSEADVLTMGEPGCYLNVSGYLSRHHPDRKALHIVDLLADASGIQRS